jgi:TPR repeat protein
VHNDYLNTLADWGLVGAVLVAAAWGIFYWQVFRAWPFVQRTPNDLTSKRSNKASFVLGGALGLLAILIHSFLDFNMHIPANAMLAVTLMALVAGHFRFATERYWVTLHTPLRGVVTVVLLAALGYLGVETWRRTRECHWLVRAEGLKLYTPEQTDAFRRAFAADGKNFEAAHEVGECLRMRGWDGGDAGKELVKEAMQWFKRSFEMNPFNPHPVTRYGMCLDWLGQHEEAAAYFKRAQALDPNGYLTLAYMGWHYMQLEDFAAARTWFEKSLRLNSYSNELAVAYLKLIDRRLSEPSVLK